MARKILIEHLTDDSDDQDSSQLPQSVFETYSYIGDILDNGFEYDTIDPKWREAIKARIEARDNQYESHYSRLSDKKDNSIDSILARYLNIADADIIAAMQRIYDFFRYKGRIGTQFIYFANSSSIQGYVDVVDDCTRSLNEHQRLVFGKFISEVQPMLHLNGRRIWEEL